jgi:hypothetical protein
MSQGEGPEIKPQFGKKKKKKKKAENQICGPALARLIIFSSSSYFTAISSPHQTFPFYKQ